MGPHPRGAIRRRPRRSIKKPPTQATGRFERNRERDRPTGESMAIPSRFAWRLPVVAVLLASEAGGGTPDPSTLRDQLEEQVLEGDADAEDVSVFHLPARSISAPNAGTSYVALAAFAGSAGVRREWGGFLVVQFPFDRGARARPLPLSTEGAGPPSDASGDADAPPPRP